MEYIQVAGKSEIWLGFPGGSDSYGETNTFKLGEQGDETRVHLQNIIHDVPGDANGGSSGPPIEKQILGQSATADFSLSRFDPLVVEKLESFQGVFSKPGTIKDSELGSLLLRDHSICLYIVPRKGASLVDPVPDPLPLEDNYFYRRFPCCILTSPIVFNQGTKWTNMQFTMEAFAAPLGHPLNDSEKPCERILWDRDDSLISTLITTC